MTSKADEPNEPAARAIVAQALRFSESERVRVAAELLASVDGSLDAVTDDEWLAEINRRADSVRRGAATVSVIRGRSYGTRCSPSSRIEPRASLSYRRSEGAERSRALVQAGAGLGAELVREIGTCLRASSKTCGIPRGTRRSRSTPAR